VHPIGTTYGMLVYLIHLTCFIVAISKIQL
jgi:hypothetical protein